MPEDLDTLEELCIMVRESSLCGLGQNAPNPILSTLRFFREEYEEHTLHNRCAAGVCKFTETPLRAGALCPVPAKEA